MKKETHSDWSDSEEEEYNKEFVQKCKFLI